MQKKCLYLLLTLLLNLSNVYADDLEEALYAYSSSNYAAAEKLLLPLSQNGDKQAQYLMGNIYLDGLTGTTDITKAINYYKMAIKNKHRLAATTLGRIYLSGLGVPIDIEKGSYYTVLADSFPSEFEADEDCD